MLWIHTFELAKRKGRTVMTSGLLLIIIAGICWIGAGIIVSACSARSWNYNIVQGLSYLGATLICALLLIGKAVSHSSWEAPGWSVLASCLAGIANFYAFDFTAKAMQRGPNGLVWGIMQAGMIGSFLMGVICFGEKAAPLRLLGLVLILIGVLTMGLSKDEKSAAGGKNWILPSLIAFLLVMTTHCCNTLPSYFPETAGSDALFRTMGLYFGGVIGFALTTLPGMIRERKFGGRGEWITAGILMILNTSASVFFFYKGLDLLAEAGCGGLGYPVSIGVCIVGFSLYSLLILKEKIARLGLAGLISVCMGIIILSIRW